MWGLVLELWSFCAGPVVPGSFCPHARPGRAVPARDHLATRYQAPRLSPVSGVGYGRKEYVCLIRSKLFGLAGVLGQQLPVSSWLAVPVPCPDRPCTLFWSLCPQPPSAPDSAPWPGLLGPWPPLTLCSALGTASTQPLSPPLHAAPALCPSALDLSRPHRLAARCEGGGLLGGVSVPSTGSDLQPDESRLRAGLSEDSGLAEPPLSSSPALGSESKPDPRPSLQTEPSAQPSREAQDGTCPLCP